MRPVRDRINRLSRFLLRRFGFAVAMLLVVSTASYALLAAAPGDPALHLLLSTGTPAPNLAQLQVTRESLGLNDPLFVRYLHWLGGALTGDFGTSYRTGRSVSSLVVPALGWTLLLAVTSLVISLVLAITLGTFAGLRPSSWPARVVGAITTVTYSIPPFVLALVALFTLAVHWQLFPAGGVGEIGEDPTPSGVVVHLILPAVVLALGATFGLFTRIVAASVTEAAQSEYALAAGARGVSHARVVTGHVLRTSLLPLVAQVGASMNAIVVGTLPVEVVFSWPGLGPVAVVAAQNQDYSVMMAIVLITGVVVVMGNLLADLASSALDPRIRAIPERRRRAIRGALTPAATP